MSERLALSGLTIDDLPPETKESIARSINAVEYAYFRIESLCAATQNMRIIDPTATTAEP